MRYALALAVLLLSGLDHWTTWLCLRAPVAGWEVAEANPLAAWLFARVGLVPGLLLDSAVTLLAVGFVVGTPRLPAAAKATLLGALALLAAAAVANNLEAAFRLGLAPFGGG